MEIGRQINVLAVWAEKKGRRGELESGRESWNLNVGASSEKGAHKDGQFWGVGRLLALQLSPTCLRSILREAEVGGRRRRVSGREKGREEKKRKGENIGQKIDMSTDHPPFLCLSAWWADTPHRQCGGLVLGGNQLHSLRRRPWEKG